MSKISIDETHDPNRISWVESAQGHADFPIQNLPYGIFSVGHGAARPGVAIGDEILDLSAIKALLPEPAADTLGGTTLNALFALPSADRNALRRRLSELLSDAGHRDALQPHMFIAADCTLQMPATVGDYTDFYVGIHHAMNVGKQFRPDNPLLPNYKYVPIGYHGRASSLRPSGVPVRRPQGQRKIPNAEAPVFSPCLRLDYELEMGVWIGSGNSLGSPIPIGEAMDHIVGFCLLNDWSARDIQTWEYQPLGPFLAKNFHSTISPWVITAEAMAPYFVAQPPRPAGDPAPLPYLWSDADQAGGALGVELEVAILTARMREQGLAPFRLSRGPATSMYWTVAQIVTHHTSNGCNLNPGDLLGTGTISAPTDDGFGSMLEITRGGAKPVTLPTGETRDFLQDGDEIVMTARASAKGRVSLGFGACRAHILGA